MKLSRVPGLAVGIVRRDRVVYLRGFGATAGRPVTPQTPFLIGSLSKSFTALAVMQLVEAGKLDLDAPVHRYLPWFRLKDEEASRAITVRHLLNQTSGLPTSAGFFTAAADRLSRTELARPVGVAYQYCNLNYKILGLLIEAVSGLSYAAYVQGHVLDPLGMRSTHLTYEDAVSHGLAGAHQYLFGLPIPTSISRYDDRDVADGRIASSAEDMCRYLSAQLQGGVYDGRVVISPEGLALMHRPPGDVDSRYGMGWVAGEWDGLESVWHTGLNEGFSSNMNILSASGYGVVILADVNSFTLHNDLMDGILRRLHGRPTKSYFPFELLQRLLLLFTLLFGIALLARRLWRWRGLGYPLSVRMRAGAIANLAIGVSVGYVLLFAVPRWADSPLEALMGYQPDIGYGVICGAIIFTLAGFIGALVNSKLSSAPAA